MKLLTITPEMISRHSGEGNEKQLISTDGSWFPGWDNFPAVAVIDLGQEYTINKISFNDLEGVGDFLFEVFQQNVWYEVWQGETKSKGLKEKALLTNTRYVRVSLLEAGANINSLKIYGEEVKTITETHRLEISESGKVISTIPVSENISFSFKKVVKTDPDPKPDPDPDPDPNPNPDPDPNPDPTPSGDITFADKMGVNAVLDHPMSDLSKFERIRLYLFSQDWSKDNQPNSIFIKPLLGFGGSYSLVKWIQDTQAKVMVSMRNNPEFTPVADGPSGENLGNFSLSKRVSTSDRRTSDELLNKIASLMERPPKDLSLLRLRILKNREIPDVDQVLIDQWLNENETSTRAAVSDFPSYMYLPANYKKHANGFKMLHDALVNAGVTDQTQAIGLGNEFEEHWKDKGDWPAEAQAALLAQVDVMTPKSARKIDVGLAGHVAPDYRQLEREAAKYIELGLPKGYYPGDYIQLHWYYNQASSQNWENNNQYKQGIDFSKGALHPEGGSVNLRKGLDNYKNKIDELWPNSKPYLVYGEWGWDIGFNDASDPSGGGDSSPQIAHVSGQSNQKTQAQWTVRADMQIFFSKTAISYQYFYDHVWGGGGGWLFGSCGLVDGNNSIKMISYYYKLQQLEILKGYKAESIIQEDSNAYIYRLEDDSSYMYVAWSPTASKRSVEASININRSKATQYTLKDNSLTPSTIIINVSNGQSLSFTLSETPIYFKVDK